MIPWFNVVRNQSVCLGDDDIRDVEGVGTILIKRLVNGKWIDGKIDGVTYRHLKRTYFLQMYQLRKDCE